MSRRATLITAAGIAFASWAAMGLALGYVGMQRSISLRLTQIGEVIPAYLAGGIAALGICWLVIVATKRIPRVPLLFYALVGLDLLAAGTTLLLFNEVPAERILMVILAATGGGAQLVGAALARYAFRRTGVDNELPTPL
jgi:hypothetical protein